MDEKKVYIQPELHEYGSLETITLAGNVNPGSDLGFTDTTTT